MNTSEKELDYDKLCADPAYRADVDAARKSGLIIESRNPRHPHEFMRNWSDNGAAPKWLTGWQYRIAPGQQWPIPTEQPERKAREWDVMTDADGRIHSITSVFYHGKFRVREVLPGDDAEKLRAEVERLKREIAAIWGAEKTQSRRADVAEAERDQLRAEVAELKRRLANKETGNGLLSEKLTKLTEERQGMLDEFNAMRAERDAALIELGRKQIGKKVTARAAEGVVPKCGPLPQSVFDGAPEWVNWAHVACPLGAVIWTELQCRPKISGWWHPDGGRATNSGRVIPGVSWQLSQTRRHRA